MGLFGRKHEFSGRPVATDADTLDDGRTGPNTLHKRGSPTTTTGTMPPNSAVNPAPTATTTRAEPAATTYGYQGGPAYNNGPTNGTIDSKQDSIGRKKTRGGGLFGRRNRSTSPGTSSDDASLRQQQALNQHGTGYGNGVGGGPTYGSGTGYGGYGVNNSDDPMDVARGKVHAAEAAEREALRMLGVARAAVKEAHEHVERLSKQADEE